MKRPILKFSLGRMSAQVAIGLVTAISVALVATVLVPGFRLANTLADNAAALKFVGEQRRFPRAIESAADAVQDRLNSRGYVDAPLDQLRVAVDALSASVSAMSQAQPNGWLSAANNTAALADPAFKPHVDAVRSAWEGYRDQLGPLIQYHGLPYSDNESSGTSLNAAGRLLLADTTGAIHAGRKVIPQIDAELGKIGQQLQIDNARAIAELRLVMFIGLAIATVLVVLVVTLQIARLRQDKIVKDARSQTENIFRTVKEGLFLLDKKLVIGTAHSAAMTELFKRDDIAGLSFEKLLVDIVPEKTLKTAMKYVNVLWSERTKENLIKSINPLGEVEVRFETDSGAVATQYLEFDFHRVRTGDEISHVLVSVSDVSARVALANELKDSQERTQAQIDTLLSLLQVDPAQLSSFLNDSDASMKMINAILREPAREENAFKKKLDSIFRQVHSIKGESSALGLTSIEARAHSFEEDLQTLREKRSGLSGNDFLPLIVKLDDLLTHMQSIRDLVSRLSRLQLVTREPAPTSGTTPATSPVAPKSAALPSANPSLQSANSSLQSGSPTLPSGNDMVPMLEQLTERVATENGRSARLECVGLADLPASYRRMVKDISVQAIRNAVVHGIEPAAARTSAGKSECGLIRIQLQAVEEGGYKLTLEDDGQGLQTERIIATARERGLISAEEAATFDNRLMVKLLFRAGFSTATQTTADAGRGVGMNAIADLVQTAGGRISVSTAPGRYTRLSITLPALQQDDADTEAA